ncbi:MAG: phosphoribosylamine--glycine ligase [Candidatus Spechtbacteria bacterium RIFCSPHIGHO2_02_FULL_43_15b]|uniref:phosphoribosylamine--glycine ligase n=1 Tax=Candidatus Spechtbacteria bacterium RIFCSPHIGHO2_01_FULL_43_30 TaxID=1802158 RepID=A0A1G2H563_9BACT|nr:MAG: phosphoribosylamine--glycine ligase [Candidatus Spechtbacteria bacterium RIFCSPHIGHO2_01_FULL_43_30]OGZ59886.1 MAG: phosphoribosylamine--glycine ligase [Candidatus Spechtbacteria bacterium RIFCSPHIGHO2_02_FULL_43_15b]
MAWTVKKEGHQIKAYIKERGDIDVYDGIIEKVNDWRAWQDWADVIVFDDVEFGHIADKLRRAGKLVVGGSDYTDKLEMDRGFGQIEMKKYGIPILPHRHFSNYDEAIQFIKSNPDRYVFKPSGNTPSTGKGLLIVGQEDSGEDLVQMLEKNKDVWQKKAPVFVIQKFVQGVEIGVGAFFNGNDFIYPINVNFEHKRLFPGNLGPLVGEAGTMMYWSKPNKIFQDTLEKMLPAIRESKYVGYIDINCIVNGSGIYPLEFTSRFGYPTIQIQQEGILMPMGELLYRMAKGDALDMRTKRGFQVGVRIFIPSYFVPKKEASETVNRYHDLPILLKNPKNTQGMHIEDVKIQNGVWRVAGTSGVLFVVTASARTVIEAQRKVYSRLKNITAQDMFYRVDIGTRWFEDSDKLQTWGYL